MLASQFQYDMSNPISHIFVEFSNWILAGSITLPLT